MCYKESEPLEESLSFFMEDAKCFDSLWRENDWNYINDVS